MRNYYGTRCVVSIKVHTMKTFAEYLHLHTNKNPYEVRHNITKGNKMDREETNESVSSRKYFVKKDEITNMVLDILQTEDSKLTDGQVIVKEALLNAQNDKFSSVPKLAATAFQYMMDNHQDKLIGMIASDPTAMIRFVRDVNEPVLEWLYNNLPVIITPEKCICGSPAVASTQDGKTVYNCNNPLCLVHKFHVSAEVGKWNELMTETRGKKKEEVPESPPIQEKPQEETLTDLIGEI